jgi:peptidoglycan/xylan/chitin deacetylase (PgdA/CDA1 family)
VEAVARMGHLLANHSFAHDKNLFRDASSPPELALDDIRKTDALIAPFLGDRVRLFRAPSGKWSGQRLATFLNDNGLAHYLGPVHWDIDGEDYNYWKSDAQDIDACADHYRRAIATHRKGIILMHDSSVSEKQRRNHRTFEVVQRLVPQLKRDGYSFAPLDQVLRHHLIESS